MLVDELAELTALAGPSGGDGEVADYVGRALASRGLTGRRDAVGNVLVSSGPVEVLVSAHMDQVGFMVSQLAERTATCLPVGDPDLDDERETVVHVLTRAGRRPGTLRCREVEDEAVFELVDVSELSGLAVGDRVLFAPRFDREQPNGVCATALDDRIGCLILLEAAGALAEGNPHLGFAWTVGEECDSAGVLNAAASLGPRAVVSVDVTPADLEPAHPADSQIRVGAGPAITLLDEGMIAYQPMLEGFAAGARNLGIGWQPEVVSEGASEAGTVQSTLGIPGLALLVPTESVHTSHERADIGDIDATLALLVEVLPRLASGSAL